VESKVENRDKICILIPLKIMGGVGDMSASVEDQTYDMPLTERRRSAV